jgi:hypothetical protein
MELGYSNSISTIPRSFTAGVNMNKAGERIEAIGRPREIWTKRQDEFR